MEAEQQCRTHGAEPQADIETCLSLVELSRGQVTVFVCQLERKGCVVHPGLWDGLWVLA